MTACVSLLIGSGILPATPATQGEAAEEVLNTSWSPYTAEFLNSRSVPSSIDLSP